jgi:hypothetical protein
MKVYDQNLTGAASAGSARTQELQKTGKGESARSSGAGSSGGDRVELSGALGTLARALAASATSRAGRVQALAGQYQSGLYQSDPAATSRGMVADALASGMR